MLWVISVTIAECVVIPPMGDVSVGNEIDDGISSCTVCCGDSACVGSNGWLDSVATALAKMRNLYSILIEVDPKRVEN